MFESAEIGHVILKSEYEQTLPELRQDLLNLQQELRERKSFPVVILIGGVDGAGKSETVKVLNEWMDPRFIETRAMGAPTEEELAHPPMWRFWNVLPPKGKISIFFGSWYTSPIIDRVYDLSSKAELDQAMERVVRFERMLFDEGALVLKFWFHLSKEQQKERLKRLKNDPDTRWRVTQEEEAHFKNYDKFRKVSERALRLSSRAEAPWIIVEGMDPRFRYLTVAKTILTSIQQRLAQEDLPSHPAFPALQPPIDQKFLLQSLDFAKTISKKEYEKKLEKYQRSLNLMVRSARFKKQAAILVFEGSDAAGKGGAIRRISGALDPRSYQIVPIAAPTQEEREKPYLWRFWRHIQRRGTFTIFDRSWYGRVLVERVEGFCSEYDWQRAYSEINDFEEQLTQGGASVIKFWLSISKEEQLKRFQEREKTVYKRFKITDEDWRNREKWEDYEIAVSDMIDRTSTELAPWTIVEANDKYFARIKVLETICERLELALS
ncbi:polyphosphate:AMP phosphotransferase [bacterium (Candidatus Blackallbacteria) CG17_big_fil_post_rev_8_21_14_2_50_48_46]|uniref:Polyphosphate:AMP phosphotransferase n=1 Tax=bacterium (Candidatus Blackallbacteria) CG17_big_fil_post_rev_8_21_14_2_50_48_46 TaxID=2014261 RepID=A0A2M7GAW0_9BACT|nr:MAG: polyphosphate:AMP phosphotransferase [bacterium (Candidatus Blackallbacteria) CG18_big_fil_WC_8_21_14_2_50_49_26]PIW19326.1 MAG: polyphosphate:AMP phosphotransferase [bacterium (Candidatus Blackallbacteria) CG17_big_fil_post_rev_8_21_14_2_50_48_46]PIW49070.1 MAG: polyphosphate:AMP phosphotransferase [bacterium (Candidatus Blackallbacteria) CG13_big_fil_rev_8_21_14_2_50_49_14]